MNCIFINVSKSWNNPLSSRSHAAWKMSVSKKNDFQILVEVAENEIKNVRAIMNGVIVEPSQYDSWEGERVNFRSTPLECIYTPEVIATIMKKVEKAFVSPTIYVVKMSYDI